MIRSTIENIDSVNIENIPPDNLGINREIEKLQQDRQMILSELERREAKI